MLFLRSGGDDVTAFRGRTKWLRNLGLNCVYVVSKSELMFGSTCTSLYFLLEILARLVRFIGVAGDVWCVVLSSFVIIYLCESELFVLCFALLCLINFLFMNI
jgi:hypothetical protein